MTSPISLAPDKRQLYFLSPENAVSTISVVPQVATLFLAQFLLFGQRKSLASPIDTIVLPPR
ncbi:hypothetical protein SLEP1_g7438 [Rubroshorea leprosula]|uniref:Uncharacterized protein n=1 Tax=Rubroshorea leprosula TaxID=152421 RepID=A0AAV5I993_9ROSI|nr:hypothetical protein SLEP1_g7438 [Rubroshorea leprosula]